MASSGTTRHSKKLSEGVTIDIDPNEVLTPDDSEAVIEPSAAVDEQVRGEDHSEPDRVFSTGPDQGEVSPKQAVAAQGRSGGLLAGILGGLIALTGGAALQWTGILPAFQSTGELAALQQQISALSEKTASPGIDPAVFDGLVTAQAGLQKNAESLASGLSAVEDSQKAIRAEIGALKAADGVASGDPAAISALMNRLAALESSASAGGESELSAKIADIEGKLQGLAQNTGNGSGAVARAIAAAGLKAAIDRGGSFAAELETYATVSPDSTELGQLRKLAASGVPSKTELTAQFSDAANLMIEATRAANPNDGILQRLADSAKSMVRSRPVGDVPGDTPEAVIARMEVAVNRGDLDAALGEAGKLPQASQAAGADYIGKMTARRETDVLVTKALTSALGAAGAAK